MFWWRRIKIAWCFPYVFNSRQTPQKMIRKRKAATLLRSAPPCPHSPPNPAGTWCSVLLREASPLYSAVFPWSHWAGGRVVWRIPGLRTSRAGVHARCASGWRRARRDIRKRRSYRGTAAGTRAAPRHRSRIYRRLADQRGSGIKTVAMHDRRERRSLCNHQGAHNTCCSWPNGNESPGGMRPCWDEARKSELVPFVCS